MIGYGERAAVATASSAEASTFASARSRGQWVIRLLAVDVVLGLIAVWSTYSGIGLLSAMQAGQIVAIADAEAVDARQAFIGIAQLVVLLVNAVVFLMWLHRSYSNLTALGARHTRFSPGWAVGYWFVPVLNLFRPYQVVAETWKASNPEVDASDQSALRAAKTAGTIKLWWAFWLLSSFAGQISFRAMSGADTPAEIINASWASLFGDATSIAAALLCMLFVSGIDRMQETKHAHPG
jgi:hypothetical protein